MNVVDHKALAYLTMDLGSKAVRQLHKKQQNINSFEGQMQQLIINGKSYFELVDNGNLADSVNHSVTFIKNDLHHKYPLKFHNANSWLALPKIDAYHMLLIQFHFRTTEENGLILYNGGAQSDYVAVELLNGQISYSFSLGKTINTIKSKSKKKLNDNKWHLVNIWRSTKSNHELTVDSLVYTFSSDNNQYTIFNLGDKLYIGSLPNKAEYNELKSKLKIFSRTGFKGCLASIEINGRAPDYDDILSNNDKMFGNISKGCGSIFELNIFFFKEFFNDNLFKLNLDPADCTAKTCKNGGVCMAKWVENKKICNCDYTSFIGNNCDKSKLHVLKNYNSGLKK